MRCHQEFGELLPCLSAWVSYLLVVSDEDEVLACLAQRGDGVGLEDLRSLLYDHQARTHRLQNFPVLGRPCCCHANNLMESMRVYLTTSAYFDYFYYFIYCCLALAPSTVLII